MLRENKSKKVKNEKKKAHFQLCQKADGSFAQLWSLFARVLAVLERSTLFPQRRNDRSSCREWEATTMVMPHRPGGRKRRERALGGWELWGETLIEVHASKLNPAARELREREKERECNSPRQRVGLLTWADAGLP